MDFIFDRTSIYNDLYPHIDTLSEQIGYTSIKVPSVLAEKIKNVANEEGYRSISEFIMEATRMRLKDFQSRT